MKEEIVELRSIIGGWALRALRNGKPLQIWRRSSPHNWFIEGSRDFLWHSDEYDRRVPNLDLFRLESESERKIQYYGGSDSGMSELSLYVLKDEYLI